MHDWLDVIEFFYIKFYYDPKSALVPRFDTECLVREAIKTVKENDIKILVDVWTWTWIIPISIEKNTNSLTKIYWIDISEEALIIANKNKELNNSTIELIESDLLTKFLNWEIQLDKRIILITANLPYIKDDDRENMWEDVKNEPRVALFWWKDTWFELYEKFFEQIFELKSKYSDLKIIIICEFWFDQSKIAEDYFQNKNLKFKFFLDLCWVIRFIYIEI